VLDSTAAGLATGLSLIVAIGAQNAFVLRQGIRREHVLLVVAICTVSDAALIALGVGGAGALFTAVPWLVDVARWAGAAFLAGYGVLAARRAIRGSGALRAAGAGSDAEAPALVSTAAGQAGTAEGAGGVAPAGSSGSAPAPAPAIAQGGRPRGGAVATALACLAITWLNPHVYLDTVVLLGSVASTHGELRWAFGAGAMLGSVIWFGALGAGARLLAPVFARPVAWRVLDAVIAAVMLALAVTLALPALG
jgi:L-lysine exporter family protein LysE/ArgO